MFNNFRDEKNYRIKNIFFFYIISYKVIVSKVKKRIIF